MFFESLEQWFLTWVRSKPWGSSQSRVRQRSRILRLFYISNYEELQGSVPPIRLRTTTLETNK